MKYIIILLLLSSSLFSALTPKVQKRLDIEMMESKIFSFDFALTTKVKEEIREFLRHYPLEKDNIIKINSYSYKSTAEYSLTLSLIKGNKVKKFLVNELGYNQENIFVLAYGNSNYLFTGENERVSISITSGENKGSR